jgi:hypothetical protein
MLLVVPQDTTSVVLRTWRERETAASFSSSLTSNEPLSCRCGVPRLLLATVLKPWLLVEPVHRSKLAMQGSTPADPQPDCLSFVIRFDVKHEDLPRQARDESFRKTEGPKAVFLFCILRSHRSSQRLVLGSRSCPSCAG